MFVVVMDQLHIPQCWRGSGPITPGLSTPECEENGIKCYGSQICNFLSFSMYMYMQGVCTCVHSFNSILISKVSSKASCLPKKFWVANFWEPCIQMYFCFIMKQLAFLLDMSISFADNAQVRSDGVINIKCEIDLLTFDHLCFNHHFCCFFSCSNGLYQGNDECQHDLFSNCNSKFTTLWYVLVSYITF